MKAAEGYSGLKSPKDVTIAVDWWTPEILIYEMQYRTTPSRARIGIEHLRVYFGMIWVFQSTLGRRRFHVCPSFPPPCRLPALQR